MAKDGKQCDDGDACTASDNCQAGQWSGAANTCLCATNADCAAKEDGDFCNGTLYCDVIASKCKTDPATVVTCPSVDDTVCSTATCQPKTGQCAAKLTGDGNACDGDNACSKGDACQAGVCKSGVSTCGCKVDADCGQFDDGKGLQRHAGVRRQWVLCHQGLGGVRRLQAVYRR